MDNSINNILNSFENQNKNRKIDKVTGMISTGLVIFATAFLINFIINVFLGTGKAYQGAFLSNSYSTKKEIATEEKSWLSMYIIKIDESSKIQNNEIESILGRNKYIRYSSESKSYYIALSLNKIEAIKYAEFLKKANCIKNYTLVEPIFKVE